MLKKSSLLILLSTILFNLYAEYPVVEPVNSNILFKQVQIDINENNRRISQNIEVLPLQLFTYNIKEGDTIFTISSRFNLTYDTLATLNHIENQLFFSGSKSILIPTCNGIFLNKKNEDSCLEIVINDQNIFFYPGKRFSKQDRLKFLITPFSSPLKNMKITSSYGYRENPFTGNREFHSGLDLKANTGTKIYSPYKGSILRSGYSDFYGNFLVIMHTNGYSSHYYHLKKIYHKKGTMIEKGDLVAQTGNSGRSTGPHLHFEIRLNNETINPSRLLGNI